MTNQPTIDEIKVVRWKNGRPTVIDWNGERWVYDPQTTNQGGGQNAKRKSRKNKRKKTRDQAQARNQT